MGKIIVVLLCLAFLLENANTSTSNLLNTTLPKGSRSGKSKIYKDERGYYLGADFKYDHDDGFGPYSNAMMLGLFTSQTILTKDCLNFEKYDCGKWGCEQRAGKKEETLPYLQASGTPAGATVYVDYNNWKLNVDALVADHCPSNTIHYGKSYSGIIGLGLDDDSQVNFIESPLFSVYIQKDKSGGLLLFKKDVNYASSKTPIAEIVTSRNWKASIKKGSLQIGDTSLEINTDVIFDLHSDAIGFPKTIYNSLLGELTKIGVKCGDIPSYQPKCTYNGFIYNLPTIYIKHGNIKIPIPAGIYVQNGNSKASVKEVVLNIRVLGDEFTGGMYVTTEFSNTIILDSNFMGYYYTVFDGTGENQKITLYLSGELPNDNPPIVYIILGSFVALLFIGILCSCCKTKPSAKEDPTNINNQTQIMNQSLDPIQYSQFQFRRMTGSSVYNAPDLSVSQFAPAGGRGGGGENA